MMHLKTLLTAIVLASCATTTLAVWAQQQPSPELLKAMEFFGTAGIP